MRGLAAALALAGASTAVTASPAQTKMEVGAPAPDALIRLVDGSEVRLSALRGEVVVLNFWATWCAPCRKELPTLDRYFDLRKANGLRVFAVTTEDSLPISRLRKLFAAMTIPAARSIGDPYARVKAVPTNYVIGRDGTVRYAKAASFSLDDLNHILVPLLNEPAPPAP